MRSLPLKLRTPSVTIRLVEGGMVIESLGTTLYVILFFMLPIQLHWLHERRFLHSSLDPRAALLTSSFPIGNGVNLVVWT